jgi:hypothetical protein
MACLHESPQFMPLNVNFRETAVNFSNLTQSSFGRMVWKIESIGSINIVKLVFFTKNKNCPQYTEHGVSPKNNQKNLTIQNSALVLCKKIIITEKTN